jgi:hypothetical protein
MDTFIKCLNCEKEIIFTRKDRKYCSDLCNTKYQSSSKNPKNKPAEVDCKKCGKKFTKHPGKNQIFCSLYCKQKFYLVNYHQRPDIVKIKRQSAIIRAAKIQKKIEEERVAKGLPARLKRKFNSAEEREAAKKEKFRKSYWKNREKIRAYQSTPEVRKRNLESTKRYYSTPEGKLKRKLYTDKLWLTKGEELKAKSRTPERRKKILERHYKRKLVDTEYRVIRTLRSRLASAVKIYKQKGIFFKKGKTLDLLGCSMEYFIQHIENQFKPDMTWNNHGMQKYNTERKWNIDHIKAVDKFDLTDVEQQKECFHWSNMQPLWQEENREKWYN